MRHNKEANWNVEKKVNKLKSDQTFEVPVKGIGAQKDLKCLSQEGTHK